jgi:hypothetical protein
MRARPGRYVLASTLIALVLVVPAPAFAGGSWIEGRGAYGVGDTATFRGSFSMSGSLEGELSDGPYVAYLAPPEIYAVDHPSAIRLGEIQMRRSERWGMIASITFTVPAVATGRYHLTYCNEPCTVNGIGDLVGGDAFYVAPTQREALLLARVDHLSWRVQHARENGRREARRAVEALEERLDSQARQLAEAEARAATLEARLAELRSASARAEEPRAALAPGWAVVAAAFLIAMGVIAAAVIVRRRRLPDFVVPDTIPDELDALEPALRG